MTRGSLDDELALGLVRLMLVDVGALTDDEADMLTDAELLEVMSACTTTTALVALSSTRQSRNSTP